MQDTLEYTTAINLCYQRLYVVLQARVPPKVTWAVTHVLTKILKHVVKQCILNQTRGYWLLSDALFVALTIYMRRCLELNHRQGTWLQFCDFDVELEVLYGRMACEVTCVLYPFISFACAFKAEKVHNMLALILGP